jgi:hypothetical protein
MALRLAVVRHYRHHRSVPTLAGTSTRIEKRKGSLAGRSDDATASIHPGMGAAAHMGGWAASLAGLPLTARFFLDMCLRSADLVIGKDGGTSHTTSDRELQLPACTTLSGAATAERRRRRRRRQRRGGRASGTGDCLQSDEPRCDELRRIFDSFGKACLRKSLERASRPSSNSK